MLNGGCVVLLLLLVGMHNCVMWVLCGCDNTYDTDGCVVLCVV